MHMVRWECTTAGDVSRVFASLGEAGIPRLALPHTMSCSVGCMCKLIHFKLCSSLYMYPAKQVSQQAAFGTQFYSSCVGNCGLCMSTTTCMFLDVSART